jgi:hypothetical protein
MRAPRRVRHDAGPVQRVPLRRAQYVEREDLAVDGAREKLAVEIAAPGEPGAGLPIECEPRRAVGGVEALELAVDVVTARRGRARRKGVKVLLQIGLRCRRAGDECKMQNAECRMQKGVSHSAFCIQHS